MKKTQQSLCEERGSTIRTFRTRPEDKIHQRRCPSIGVIVKGGEFPEKKHWQIVCRQLLPAK